MTIIKIKSWDGSCTSEKLIHAEKTIDNGTQTEIKSLAIALLVKFKELSEE